MKDFEKALANLETQPRVPLTELPTPIQFLEHLTEATGGPAIYIKRDDLTTLGLGGNKTRKLEFLLGRALDQGCDTLVTAGGIQSNHCRLTAAAARQYGLACHLVLNGEPGPNGISQGNLLLDNLFGAQVHFCTRPERDATLEQTGKDLAAKGKNPFVIPVGGSTGTGALGYVAAMRELTQQLREQNIEIDAIAFASSSGGTQAGLALGARLTGFKGRILGISIDQTKTGTESFLPILADIANDAAQLLDADIQMGETDFSLNCDYLGAGYAIPGDLELNAIQDLALQEAVLLGPVYTARAMGGFLDLVKKGLFTKGQSVLFWHTGGTPELFAFADLFKP